MNFYTSFEKSLFCEKCMAFRFFFVMILPTLLFGSYGEGEILRTEKTIIQRRTMDHPWINMNGKEMPYNEDQQKLLQHSGQFFRCMIKKIQNN